MVLDIEARFWAKVDRSGGPDACWPWTAFVNDKGYGQYWDGIRLVRAHRHAHETESGPIPAGEVVDHECHNDSGCTAVPCEHRRCCNPKHLQTVTQKVNSILGRSGDHQSAKTECPSGHPYSPDNTILTQGGKHRACRICMRASQRKYNLKRKAA